MSIEKFKISARLMIHLGEALISDELVALTELIKNSYDADSNYSSIIVDSKHNDGKGIIVVEDDGSGMDDEIIKNSFLVLATDFKIKTQKTSPKYKRIALGNKGIGRLSLQRLGNKCSVLTKMENKNAYSFSISWDDFLDPEKEIYDIKVELKESPELNSSFAKGHGTKITIESIKNVSLWESKLTIKRFKNEILSIINPYSIGDERFVISMDINGEKIISDQYNIDLIREYSDVYSSFEYISKENKLTINITRQKKYIDLMIKYLKSLVGKDTLSLVCNEEELYNLFKKERLVVDLNNIFEEYPYIDDKEYKLNKEYLPGDFCGEIFAFDKTAGRFSNDQKQFLEIINGVKLFRNNFRILPYGDIQNDWLNFTKYSQTLKSNIYKNHTTTGYVYINGEENLKRIKEMTNRQGIIHDEYGDSFLTICSVVLSRILVQRDINFSSQINPSRAEILGIDYGKSRSFCGGLITFKKKENYIEGMYKAAEVLKEAIQRTKDRGNAEYKGMSSSLNDITLKLKGIKTQVETEKELISVQQKSIDNFKITIGSALVSEFMSHEIMRAVNNSLDKINRIKELLSKRNFDMDVIYVLLDSITTHLNYLSKYASVIDFNSYTKRRTKEMVNLKELVENIVNDLPFLSNEDSDIECIINGDDCDFEVIKTNFTIAIENILINSKYWLDRNDIKNKRITIDFNSVERTITIFDNGTGIHKEIEDKIFEAFVSAKPENEGRGIGLYITDKLLMEMGIKISLSKERNESGRLYKFVLVF